MPEPSTSSSSAPQPFGSEGSPPRVFLKPRKALPFFARHPWVFQGAIARVEGEPAPGDEVAVVTHDGQFIARGLFNPGSSIRVRLYSWDADRPLDTAFWSERISQAVSLRRQLFPAAGPATAFRTVFSEGDGISGLTVDRYGDWLLVQFTSRALWERRDLLLDALERELQPAGIWLRTEKGIGESEGLDVSDGLVRGAEPPRPLIIEEHGLQYAVDVVEGQKTGFYLDQRDNRLAAARLMPAEPTPGRLLDCFCYSGAFGLNAVKQGRAGEVVAVDVSESALALARSNAERNGLAARFRFEKGKAFDVLERLREAGEQFDTVVLDPPRMTRHRAGVDQALRGYFSLNRLALDVLKPGGLLVTCSCSGLVSRDDFEEMLGMVAQRAGRPIQILEARGQAADHPVSVSCLESSYLKCYICRVQ